MSDYTKGQLDYIEAPRSNLIHIDLREGDPKAPIVTGLFSIPKKFLAVARRLVACWNACEGIDTEKVETWSTVSKVGAALLTESAHEVTQLRKDRDELLAALRELLRVDDEWHGSVNSEMSHARSVARTILAKHAATGGEGES